MLRTLLKTIFVQDPGYRATIEQIKQHMIFKKVDWNDAVQRSQEAPFIPNDQFAYHNCNHRAHIVNRGAHIQGQNNLAQFAATFLLDSSSKKGRQME